MIPKKIEKEIKKNDLCSEYFKFWNNICKILKFKEKDIVDTLVYLYHLLSIEEITI